MTQIYDRFALTSRRNFPRLQLLEAVEPFVLNGQTIADAPAKPGRIYALSSGMMTPKTLSNIFARQRLERSEAFDFLCRLCRSRVARGHSARRATGRSGGARSRANRRVELRCQVENFQFSAHASRESIVAYVKKLAPKKVVLVHGDPPAVAWIQAQVATALPEAEVIVPAPGVEIEL